MQTKKQQADSGFTLIEVMVAIVLLTIGIFSLYSMQIRFVTSNMTANKITTASTKNSEQIEQRITLPYSDALLLDTDGDGTNQDTSNPLDGLDNDGGRFGLDDAQCCPGGNNPAGIAVAGCVQVADGCNLIENYYIYWNVAEGVPLPNTKTIRVLVQDPQQILARPIAFTYIKDDFI